MATFKAPNISQNDINTIMSVLKLIFGKVKERGDLIKDKSIPIMIMCAIIALATIGSLIYFILYHFIGPLMIVCAVCVIILAYGLAHSSKNFQNLMKEFEEYDNAVDNLMAELVSAIKTTNEDYTANALAIALSAELGKTQEELQAMTYADLVACPKYNTARRVIANLANMRDLVDVMAKEKLDVDKLIAQYDTTDISDECAETVDSVVDNFDQESEDETTENKGSEGVEPEVVSDETPFDDGLASPFIETQSDENISNEQQDSNGRVMYVEDTTIVV